HRAHRALHSFPTRRSSDLCRGGGESVVGLQLDHRPDHYTHGGECVLERMELFQEGALDACAGLVPGPELVAERFDHVIGSDTDVGGVVLEHLEHGAQHPEHGTVGRVAVLAEAAQAVEVAEQLVGPVQEMDNHAAVYSDRAGGAPAADTSFAIPLQCAVTAIPCRCGRGC